MNYVGKLLSNFKGFYNDINSATLTGAIDIIVVRQEDGSYTTSPFHVRFGKMGVLRSREKVVDIEINGEPVDLHMKLGEAGEAFFVQEAPEGTTDIPAYLATSPLPSTLDLMEKGIQDLRDLQSDEILQQVQKETEELENEIDQKTVITVDVATETVEVHQIPKDESVSSFISLPKKDSNQSLYQSVQGSFDRSTGLGDKVDVCIQTDVTGEDVEKRAKSPLPTLFSDLESTGLKSDISINVENSSIKSGSSTKGSPKQGSPKQGSSKESSHGSPQGSPKHSPKPSPPSDHVDSTKILTQSEQPHEQAKQSGKTPEKRKRRKRLQKKKELMKTHIGSHLDPDDAGESGSSVEGVPDEGMFSLEMTDEEDIELELNSMGRTVSMPIIDDRRARTDEWASSQYASAFHPFSDGDLTPIVSPISSRPPSPKSDTEVEYHKDGASQTHLTGDDFQTLDDVRWKWGELPESLGQHSLNTMKDEEKKTDADENKPSGGLFRFMRKTKKMRHKPEEEGIYLSELNLEEMDPEVAQLYLYNAKGSGHMRTIKDEDSESGRGASLPQSPVSMEREADDLTRPLPQKTDNLPDVAMSLCGGLKDADGEISHHKFLQYLITHDEFCQNPNILTDPNLVVRIGGKFYNWQMAGPMVMSALVFQRALPDPAVEGLIKQHMPKKEQRKRGWIWWRTTDDDSSLKKEDVTSTPSSAPSSVPNSPQKVKDRQRNISEVYSTDDESETRSECGNREKWKKSLKLTSRELMKLKLKEGPNEISFSVTTQYQGTSRCSAHIYLWNWDDRIVISDIDGTITKSDVLGQVLPMIGKDWSQAGITHLYSMINRNGYKFIYLSARAIGQSKITRDYLRSIKQSDKALPDGPLLLSPSSLISAFHREVIERKPEEFKISCLRDISALFPAHRNPFCAGYGNKINDVWAYRAVGIPISRIFTVNHRGELKLELTHTFSSSYTKLSDVVDHFFPPLMDHQDSTSGKFPTGNFPAPADYSSFTYWREPLPDVELELEEFIKTEESKS